MLLSLTDVSSSIRNPDTCIFVDELKGGRPCMLSGTIPVHGSGSFAVVYKYKLANGSDKALRIWTSDSKDIQPILNTSKEISQELLKLHSDYFLDYNYYNDAILIDGKRYPMTVMEWCKGKPLKEYINCNLQNKKKLGILADNFLKLFHFMHKHGISHGDLQHGNIMVDDKGHIKLIDYDSLYFPTPFFSKRQEIVKGYESYQHPCRNANKYMGPKVDYFSELILYISILAIRENPSLWTEYNVLDNDGAMLFAKTDFLNINESRLFKELGSASKQIKTLLDVLVDYLKQKDILNLKPFDEYTKINFVELFEELYCINCGHKNSNGDVYCCNCGTKLIYD